MNEQPNEQTKITEATQRLNSATLNINRAYKTPAIGRNDPCDCGSGKKHKYCCGVAVQQARLTKESMLYIKKKAKYLTKKNVKEAEAVVEATNHKCKNCKHADPELYDCEIEVLANKQPSRNELNNCIEFALPDIPNEATIAAINELENVGGQKIESVDKLFIELNSGDELNGKKKEEPKS
jgi:hypothetical protein